MTKPTKTPLKLSFNSKKTTKKLLDELNERMKVVVSERFGLETGVRRTLDSIGKRYGITRERVRQIESSALSIIKKSQSFEEMRAIFDEIRQVVDELGGIVSEDHLFDITYPEDTILQNHLYFYLTLGDMFTRFREDTEIGSIWTTEPKVLDNVRSILKAVASDLREHELYE